MDKECAYNSGDMGSIPGLGRYLGEGHSNPLQYSCLENPMDRGAWRTTARGVTKSQMSAEVTEHACMQAIAYVMVNRSYAG